MKVSKDQILEYFPCKKPYRFIDEILDINALHILAAYTFRETEYFFKGHFPGNPVVPGAIIQEAAAQIGLLAFGMYLLGNGIEVLSEMPIALPEDIMAMNLDDWAMIDSNLNHLFYLTSTRMDYKAIVRPKEKIFVHAEKIFFRLNKLKCNVRIENEKKELVSKGILSGVVVNVK